jgi:diadenosine tetraphosphatase ApaH/serine/threonine PP2A family protein phosphatase
VLCAIDQAQVDQTLCLGDLVGFCAQPNECVQIIRQRAIPCVQGNHDAVAAGLQEPTCFSETARRAVLWTRQQLTPETRDFLASLPPYYVIGQDLVMVHAALHPSPNADVRMRSEADASQTLQVLRGTFPGVRLCFFGHTHRIATYAQRGPMVTRVNADMVKLDEAAAYLVNPGAVGQSRDGDPRASFAIYDSGAATVRFCRTNYDRRAAEAKVRRAGLLVRPGLLTRSAERLRAGLAKGRSLVRQSTSLF